MARTVTQIYDAIIAEKQNMATLNGLQPSVDSSQTLLSDLTSTSKVAVWRLLFWVMAVATWTIEQLFDVHQAAVNAKVKELITGTALWYHARCFEYQHGDSLTWNGTIFEYAVPNTALQIIKRAAVIEVGGQVRVKVAKLDASGLPAPLSAAELSGFSTYINQVKFAGVNMSVSSNAADYLKIAYDIVFDPLVLSPTGELISSPGTFPVEDAINALIQDLPFNGVLNLTSLTDAVQAAQGVVDPVLTSAQAKYGFLAYQNIDKNYQADAGHMVIDPAYPLSNQLNYIANV